MAATIRDDDELLADVNVTPFVDVVLVLLVVLMVTSTELVRSAFKVELPRAAAAGEVIDTTINISLSKNGTYYLDGSEIQPTALFAAVAAEIGRDPSAQAVIAADTSVAYGSVIQVIDGVKRSGVKTFALNIQPELEK